MITHTGFLASRTSPLPAEVRQNERPEPSRSTDVADGASKEVPAFAVWLGATRNLVTGLRHGANAKASPQRMFEAASSDNRANRRSVLQAEDRAAPDAKTKDPLDRTGIDARRALRTASEGRDARPPVGRADRSEARGRSPSFGRQGLETSGLSRGPFGFTQAEGSLSRSDGGPTIEGRNGQDPFAPQSGLEPPARSPLIDVPTASPSTGVEGRALTGHTASVAEQVGKLLGATRAGSVESARAVSQVATNAEPPRTGSRSGPSSTSSKPEETQDQSSTKSAGHPDRSPGVSRSPFDEMIRTLRAQGGLRRSSARLLLQPPELGRLQVDVRLEGDRLNILVRAENDAARSLLARRAAQLTESLEEHGLRVQRFDVVHGAVSDTLEPEAMVDPRGDGTAGADTPRGSAPRAARFVDRKVPDDGTAEEGLAGQGERRRAVRDTRLDIMI